MDENRFIELLVELHRGLPRLGPGNAESTTRALRLCSDLPAGPAILDVGCGTGAQTLVLAEQTDGPIVAVDLMPTFLADLERTVRQEDLQERIEVHQADMTDLPFEEHSFDLIWSEGAIYIMGFDDGLSAWRRLVKSGGYLVVSEVSWFVSDPPAEAVEFWAENYPTIRSVAENLEAAANQGWESVANFHLPREAWEEDYYGPLKKRLPEFRQAHSDDPDAFAVADLTEHEISIVERFSDSFGYEFYVSRRPE